MCEVIIVLSRGGRVRERDEVRICRCTFQPTFSCPETALELMLCLALVRRGALDNSLPAMCSSCLAVVGLPGQLRPDPDHLFWLGKIPSFNAISFVYFKLSPTESATKGKYEEVSSKDLLILEGISCCPAPRMRTRHKAGRQPVFRCLCLCSIQPRTPCLF